jgi:2-polyprenyl-6-methoxyphenol hydroxylase-like FAD-dependent oxidoreductase
MKNTHDVIVVGARCAGAPTAMLLARQGYDVLLVDRATFPSDTLSTLVIHAAGVSALRRWGLLDEVVATGCPPIETYTFDFGPFVISGAPRPVDGLTTAYAPRRTRLDTILVEAAEQAGVDVRTGYSVEEVMIENGTVVGIRGHRDGEPSVVERSRVVVGADGWNSMVARAVNAVEYNTKPVLENAFYTFWRDLPVDSFVTMIRGDRGIAAIPTNDDLTLVLTGCPFAQASTFRGDVEGNYMRTIELVPEFAERIKAATRVERFTGGGVPNFFRVPFGPGWSLVGDAGYTKDPITAQGISDAFRNAERCTSALHQALSGERPYEDAMGDYQRQRDDASMPVYEFTTQMAKLEAPPLEMQAILAATSCSQAAMDGFVGVTTGSVSPLEFFDPANVATILAGSSAQHVLAGD